MNSKNNRTFKQECKIINLAIEYIGYTGDITYAVITDLTEEELNSKYKEELAGYRPFIILSRAMGLVIREQQRNEEKYKKRTARHTVDYEAVFHLLSVDDEQTRRDIELYEATRKEMIMEAGRKAMMSLTPLQRRYIIRFYIDGAELKEIANETGTRQDTVWENLEAARRKFRKALDALEVA